MPRHDVKKWGNVDPLKHYAPIQILEDYAEQYQYSDFAVLIDCGDGYYVPDIAIGADNIPINSVAFHILPENNL